MSSITTINSGDLISGSRTDINNNFSALNTDKIETSTLDTDTTLAANSDAKIATQKATKAYVDASVNPTGRSWNEYAVDSVGSDSYAITVSGISAYVAGQTFKFKAGTANTGACTLNVNALGAKTIKKDVTTDLATGDILANQIVVVTYDGTNFQLSSSVAGSDTSLQTFTASGTWTKPGKGTLAFIQVWGGGGSGAKDSVRECGGGGGGAYAEAFIPLVNLGSTETVTIGAGGALISSNGLGNAGGNTTFGSWLTGYGGGAGGYDGSNPAGGGGGGGSNAAGSAGLSGAGGAGGGILGGAANTESTFGGGGGGSSNNGARSLYGGGGGARGGGTGGSSTFGGGGGGDVGGASTFGGNGGGSSGGVGVAGTQPGGGGGRGTSGNSGAGGAGKCVVTVY